MPVITKGIIISPPPLPTITTTTTIVVVPLALVNCHRTRKFLKRALVITVPSAMVAVL